MTESGQANGVLQVSRMKAGYGKKPVLHDFSMQVQPGEIVGIIGPNGAGKSTALKAIFGLLKPWDGSVQFKGKEIQGRKPSLNVMDGIGFCPQGSRVFTELSVLENLEVGGYILGDKETRESRLQEVFNIFPLLRERQSQNAGALSGGEKQMLALGRALMLQPELLLLDEPSLGLSPRLAKVAIQRVKEINERLGTTIVVVEQYVRELLSIAHRVYLMRMGRVVLHDTSKNLLEGDRIRELFLR